MFTAAVFLLANPAGLNADRNVSSVAQHSGFLPARYAEREARNSLPVKFRLFYAIFWLFAIPALFSPHGRIRLPSLSLKIFIQQEMHLSILILVQSPFNTEFPKNSDKRALSFPYNLPPRRLVRQQFIIQLLQICNGFFLGCFAG